MQPSPLASLSWPLTVIDFEASSLDPNGYPIEVGLALWPAPDEPIRGWSALIRPAEDSTRHGHWSPASAKLHGIRGSDLLARGQPSGRIAAALNAALGPGIASMLGAARRTRAVDWLEIAPTRHRARDDAEQLLLALAHAAEVEVGPVQDLGPRLPAFAVLAMPDEGAARRG